MSTSVPWRGCLPDYIPGLRTPWLTPGDDAPIDMAGMRAIEVPDHSAVISTLCTAPKWSEPGELPAPDQQSARTRASRASCLAARCTTIGG